MSNELTLSHALTYSDTEGTSDTLALAAALATVTTKKSIHAKMAVTTAELAIPLGNLTSLGWAIFVNRDSTNFVEIRVATGSTKAYKIPAGKACGPFYFGSGVTAPFIIADTATCQVEYLICSQ